MVNNFKEIEKRRAEEFKNDLNVGIRNGIDGQMNMFKSFGRILELYVPQLMSFIIAMLGGTDENKKL